MNKYITIVDHHTWYKKTYTYLENKGENKLEAVARAVAQGMKRESVFLIKVAKRVSKDKYLPIYTIYYDGSMIDLVKTDWDGWGKNYHTVTTDMLEA